MEEKDLGKLEMPDTLSFLSDSGKRLSSFHPARLLPAAGKQICPRFDATAVLYEYFLHKSARNLQIWPVVML